MPELKEAILLRRSIRNYLPKPVPQQAVREILEAARWAPSAHNAQPWRFIVLTGAESKRELVEAMTFSDVSGERFTNIPVLIVACLTMEDMHQFPDKERQQYERDLGMQSLGAAIQNMLLAAYAQGLGSCWYCAPAFCKSAVRKALNLPSYFEPQALVALGYAGESHKAPVRKSIGDFSAFERWGKNP